MPKLVFIDKNFAGQVYELVLETTTVGRHDSNTLTIHDASVSGHHCDILTYGTEVIVRDAGSANGTYVSGTRINGQSQVKAGQLVRFGSVEARLEMEAPSGIDDSSAETAVISLKRITRDQRREAKRPKSDPSVKLEPSTPPETEGHTVLMPRPKQFDPLPFPESPAPAEKGSKGRPGSAKIWLAVVVVAVLGLLLWLLWGGP